jgi:type VI secretion system secreted protein Hcp
VTYFLKLDGITGDATQRDREDWLEVADVDWGAAQSTDTAVGRGGAARAGRPTLRPITFTTALPTATPSLFLACVQLRTIREATFEAVVEGQARPAVTLRIELEDALLGALDLSGTDGDPRPHTRFSLTYRTLTLTTFHVSDTGSQLEAETATWSAR